MLGREENQVTGAGQIIAEREDLSEADLEDQILAEHEDQAAVAKDVVVIQQTNHIIKK